MSEDQPYDPNWYEYGNLIPTYSFTDAQISNECLKSFKLYNGNDCKEGNEQNEVGWDKLTKDMNHHARHSDQCQVNYDLYHRDPPLGRDHTLQCKDNTMLLRVWNPNTNCQGRELFSVNINWEKDGSAPCINIENAFSFRPQRNPYYKDESKTIYHYRNVYEAQKFLKRN